MESTVIGVSQRGQFIQSMYQYYVQYKVFSNFLSDSLLINPNTETCTANYAVSYTHIVILYVLQL